MSNETKFSVKRFSTKSFGKSSSSPIIPPIPSVPQSIVTIISEIPIVTINGIPLITIS